jgi:hypothetical protein
MERIHRIILIVVTSAIAALLLFSSGCGGKAEMLSDQNEIINTVNRLFIATDQRKWDTVKECFDKEVLFDMTSMAGGEPVKMTPQRIVDGWERGLAGITAIHHQAGNYVVTLKGAEAEAFCYGIALHYLPNPSKKDTRVFVGSYDFHLVKQGTAWKIDRFKFNLKFIEGNKDLHTFIKAK